MGARGLAVLLISFVAGGGALVLELLSVRALAPWFGSSVEVWTSAIGVILLALSAGYGAGGVLADRRNPRQVLGFSLTLSGTLVAVAPYALPRVARVFLPEDLGLDQAAGILRMGAFATQAVLFGLPVFFLGFASPLLIRILCDGGLHPGRASGLVLWTSTVGGLTGTFATTYVLVPAMGVRALLFSTGMVFAFLGTLSLWGVRRRAAATLALLAAGSAALFGAFGLEGPVKSAGPAMELLAECESREQYLRIVEVTGVDTRGNPQPERWLQVNEGLDSFQSIDAPGRATPGHYYDMLAYAATLAGEEERPRVLLVGAGAGSTARALLEFVPGARVEGLELDPKVLDFARAHLRLTELESRGVRIHGGIDGRAGLVALEGPFDAILIDAYARQVEIPFHLITREMFQLCLRKLAPHGVVAVNVSCFGDDDPLLEAVAETMADAVDVQGTDADRPAVHLLRVRRDHNRIVFLRRDGRLPDRVRKLDALRARASASPALWSVSQYALTPEVWTVFQRKGNATPLTDDYAPLEALQAESLRRAHAASD